MLEIDCHHLGKMKTETHAIEQESIAKNRLRDVKKVARKGHDVCLVFSMRSAVITHKMEATKTKNAVYNTDIVVPLVNS